MPCTSGGRNSYLDLLEHIVELLNEVVQRFDDALNDRHGLYENHRRTSDADPEHGSWDGHRDRFNYDRDRLREKLGEWDADDKCRGLRFGKHQQEDMSEAREFAEKELLLVGIAAALKAAGVIDQPSSAAVAAADKAQNDAAGQAAEGGGSESVEI